MAMQRGQFNKFEVVAKYKHPVLFWGKYGGRV